MVATVATAHDFEVDGIYYAIISSTNKTVEVTFKGNSSSYYDEYRGNVVIPKNVTYNNETYNITSIGDEAFYGCSALTSVTIGNSVTSIGWGAFEDCTWLRSITIPNSVTSIGISAFSGTAWLNNQPDGVIYAGKVLYKYKGTMPENTNITINEGTLGIADYAFDGCIGLTSITIPNSVTSIGERAFKGCSGLTNVTIPNSVTSIGESAFQNCTGLKTVVNFSNLTFTKGSSGDGYIAYYANNVYNAPNGSIEEDCVFCKPNEVNTLVGYLGSAMELTLPGNYKGEDYIIGAYALRGCSGLTSITIPNSVTSIGNYAFYGCTGLKTVVNFSNLTFTKGSSDYGYIAYYADNVYNVPNGSIEEDYIFDEVNTLLYYLGNRNELNLPVDYKGENYVIGDNVFKNYTTLTSVTIPNSVTSIGNSAFFGCTGLTRVDIVDGVKSIGYSAFAGCSNLEELYISNTIESIADCAFKDCTNILEIKVGSKKAITCNENIFSKDVYNNALLYVPEGRKFAYEKTVPWNRFYIVETDFTDISGVKEQIAESKTVYDLQGRKVDNPTNGIYIVNGKKAFLK